uniref:Putative RNA-directed DNA polymerase, eukaryota n=1 Tax=Helianthus annuus TaxID=4232 RepID=A0A251V012_HELAN
MGAADKAGWVSSLCRDNKVDFLAIQESQKEEIDSSLLSRFWGNSEFSWEFVGAAGRSGGLVCIWNPKVFRISGVVKHRHFLSLNGFLIGSNKEINVVNVYAPHSISEKKVVWNSICEVISSGSGQWVLLGDFNAVRFPEDRLNTGFNRAIANDFNNFIEESGLVEYSMRGRKFTFLAPNSNKLSKIDRVLVCKNFFEEWPDACLRALPRMYSDHCPLFLETIRRNFGPKPFRFFDSWLAKDDFEAVIVEAMGSFVSEGGPPDMILTKKFKHLRTCIKKWRNDTVSKEKEEYARDKEELEKLDCIIETRDLEEEECWIREECMNNIRNRDWLAAMDLRQKSRCKWAIEGDENSAFFHRLINNRKKRNGIPGLNIGGEWIFKPKEVKREVLRFYRKLFTDKAPYRPALVCQGLKQLEMGDIEFLSGEFTEKEIKDAAFGCGADKAPGPDGFNFKFLKRFWRFFECDFRNIMNHFHATGEISKESSSSFITLIPKVLDPTDLKEYRPINLIGVISKVISKILANRLKLVVGKVVSVYQSAFLRDRLILDSPLILSEVWSWLKKVKKKAFIFKLDFEKAYDNVNWAFLCGIMAQMGFPPIWCKWINGILMSARSSVLVNGSPTFEFQCQKGLRQGDPLSPFLFLIVMEALSCSIASAGIAGKFSGIRLPNGGPVVSHLFYADDAIIVGNWSEDNVRVITRILRVFYACSGLKINFFKSHLFGVGVEDEALSLMASRVGCLVGEAPFNYLGIPLGANMNRVKNWDPIVKIFKGRLSSWKASSLSIGGRVILIKAVLESLPIYFFSLFKAPVKVIEKLEALMRNFLWGGSEEVRKMSWVAWDVVTRPKRYGGLGINKLKLVNEALLSKWIWRFKYDVDSLWSKVVAACHGNNRAWSVLPFNTAISGTWLNIVRLEKKLIINGQKINNLIKGVLGDGKRIRFWIDVWLEEEPLCDKFPRLFALESEKNCRVFDRLMEGGDAVSRCWKWRSPPSSDAELLELRVLSASLSLIPVFG